MDRVIPVVVIKDVQDTEPTLQALRDGGINTAEITFRTDCAAEAIRTLFIVYSKKLFLSNEWRKLFCEIAANFSVFTATRTPAAKTHNKCRTGKITILSAEYTRLFIIGTRPPA